MAKYTEIMDGLGVETTLFPESIPHLFHQDLVYLWVLEAPNRPNSWQQRIRAWKLLVELLLTGELIVIPEDLQPPLLNYTESYGVQRIQWVCLKNTNEKIAVVSPTVLVRPLPDLRPAHLDAMEQRCRDKQSPNVFRHFVQLAVTVIQRAQPEGSLRTRLAKILTREFAPQLMAAPPSSTSLRIPMLDQIVWTQHQQLGSAALQQLDIFVPGRGERVYVPLCRMCRIPLTRSSGGPGIKVESRQFQVYCEKEECGQQNDLDLYDFLIWDRDKKDVIVWGKEGILPIPEKGFPPDPVISGSEIVFEWDPAQLGAETEKCFLKLNFDDRKITANKVDNIFFAKVLLLGKPEGFSGLPIRPEWFDVLENPGSLIPDTETSPLKVTYRQLEFRGLPAPIDRVFAPLALNPEPALSAGVYPDPDHVPTNWKWYRVFLHGTGRESYRIEIKNGISILPWLVETTTGFEKELFFSIVADSNTNIGTSFWSDVASLRSIGTEPTRIPLGIDFGTTNSIVYFRPPDKEMQDVLGQPRSYCLEPRQLSDCVKWMAREESQEAEQTIGNFLPGSTYGKKRADPYLIPSGLWTFDSRFLIRWESEKPHELAEARRNFKWDTGPGSSERREGFLMELLLLALPSVLKRSLGITPVPNNVTINLGFSFPLAFGLEARNGMHSAYETIRHRLEQQTGFHYEIHSLNESLACTKALQASLNQTDTFLVADMGGGTIDLALFVGKSEAPNQIGSIKFAGETYVDVLIGKRGLDAQRLRDLIFRGECHAYYGGDPIANTVLRRFVGLVFEYMRTMVQAHRKLKPEQKVYLVLAGNGWHLVEAFSQQTSDTGGPDVFSSYYKHILEQLGDSKLNLSDPGLDVPTYKHLVAIGALQHANEMGGNELQTSKRVIAQLPAGRALSFADQSGKTIVKIEWSDLVGGPVTGGVATSDMLRDLDSQVDFTAMPPLEGSWRSYVLGLFGVSDPGDIPLPDQNNLRMYIRSSIPPEDPPSLRNGPLQIILERQGIEWLKR